MVPNMKFSKCVLLAAIAPSVMGFAPMRPVHQRPATSALNALEDLEAKLLGGDEPAKKAEKKKPAPKPTPAPKPVKKEKSKPTAEVNSMKAELEALKSTPVASPKPSPAPKPTPAPKPVKPVKEKPVPKVVPPPPKAVKPKPVVPKPPAHPAGPDALAVPKGVALGAAPLVLGPVVALAASRDFLSKTAARREAIQQEIAAREAALAKKKGSAEVDFGGVAGAAVRYSLVLTNICTC
jgi:hypothetical protein